jgi:hypothetical protein
LARVAVAVAVAQHAFQAVDFSGLPQGPSLLKA